jgi:5-methylcytosine-specific restriction protein A
VVSSWRGQGSRHSRGYGTAWDKLRLVILRRDCGICQCDECKSTGRLKVATEVDHVIPKAKGGTDDESNLVAINRECHKRKSLRDQGKNVKRRTGPDGYSM